MRWKRVGAVAAGVLAAGGTLAVAGAARGWRRATDASARRLAALADEGDAAARAEAMDALPAPVARYLAFALGDAAAAGGPRLSGARVRWAGEFRLRPDAAWRPFTAEQHFTVRPPGFVWDAAIRMLPVGGGALPMRVRDSYSGRQAAMYGSMAGLVPVVDQHGTPELASSALARWLGEAAWFPHAFLPGGPVAWEAVDDTTARAVVADGPVRASALFHFAPPGAPNAGALARMTADRYRDVEGKPVLTPFEGRYGRYVRMRGAMVPAEAEVAWRLPEGRFAYWRGRPGEVAYAYAAAAR